MTVHAAPAALRVTTRNLTLQRTVAESRGAYSMTPTRIDWGGEMWSLGVVTPLLTEAQALALTAWADLIADADGIAAITLPQTRGGTVTAQTATVSTAGTAGGRAFSVSGLGAGATLLAGSLIAVGNRLHRLRADVTGDVAALSVTPRLRADVALSATVQIGATLTTHWRLQAPPTLTWSVEAGEARAAMAFDFLEHI